MMMSWQHHRLMRGGGMLLLVWLLCLLALSPPTAGVCGWGRGAVTLAAPPPPVSPPSQGDGDNAASSPSSPLSRTSPVPLVRGGFWNWGRRNRSQHPPKHSGHGKKPLLPAISDRPAAASATAGGGADGGAGGLASVEECVKVLSESPKAKVTVEALASLRSLLTSSLLSSSSSSSCSEQGEEEEEEEEEEAQGALKSPVEAAELAEMLRGMLLSRPREKEVVVGVMEAMVALLEGKWGASAASVLEEAFVTHLWSSFLGGRSPLWRDTPTREAGVRVVSALLPHQPDLAAALLERRVEKGLDAFLHPLLEPTKVLPVGLRNCGNTCYLNSVLQQLFMARLTREGVLLASADGRSGPSSLSGAMADMLKGLSKRRGGSYNPQGFVQAARELPLTYDVEDQNDASEFFMMLLDAMRAEVPSAVEPFDGRMVNRYSCESCGHERSAREEAAIQVQVNLRGNLEASLAEMVRGTRLDDPQKCGSCGAKTIMRSQQFLARPPHTLVIQLGRFQPVPGGSYGSVMKVLERFVFPQTLDVGPYTWQTFQHKKKKEEQEEQERQEAAAAAKEAEGAAGGGNNKEEEKKDNKGKDDDKKKGGNKGQQEQGSEEEQQAKKKQPAGAPTGAGEVEGEEQPVVVEEEEEEGGSDLRYRLKGVVIHQGLLPHVGHYYSYALSDDDGKWYCLNDDSVTGFPTSEVERVWYHGGHATPLLLFYEKTGEEEGDDDDIALLPGIEAPSPVAQVPSMGLASVAVVLDLLRRLTIQALLRHIHHHHHQHGSTSSSRSSKRRTLVLTGRVLQWAMRLGHKGAHVEATRRWVEALVEVAARDDGGVGRWVRTRMARGWLAAYGGGPGEEEAAVRLRRAWVGLALAVVQGRKGEDEERGSVRAMMDQAVELYTREWGAAEGGGSSSSRPERQEELRGLLEELGARDPEALSAGLLQLQGGEEAFREKCRFYRFSKGVIVP